MMKTLQQSIQMGLLCLIAILLCTSLAAQTSLKGNISDEENGEAILFGNVNLYKNGFFITGVETDFDGNYNISHLDAGTYDVEVHYIGYSSRLITNVLIKEGKINNLDIRIRLIIGLCGIVIYDYTPPLIEKDNTTQGNIFVADPVRNILTKP